MNTKARTVVNAISLLLIVGAVIAVIVITFMAAGASGLSFWELSMLNKWGSFVLVWNYNPAAYLAVIASVVLGVALRLVSFRK